MIKKTDKPWGWEELLAHEEKYVVKRLCMRAGHRCSLQYHEYKTETIIVVSGVLLIELAEYNVFDTNRNLVLNEYHEGQVVTIQPKVIHRMSAKNVGAVYLECSTPELDDIVRLEDDYNRI